jgi:hypothetical protein
MNWIVSAFKHISCFGLRLKYSDKGEQVRATYMPSLAGLRFYVKSEKEQCSCQHRNLVEFGENSPPHLRNIFTASILQQVFSKDVLSGWFAVLLIPQRSLCPSLVQNVACLSDVNFLAYYQVQASCKACHPELAPSIKLLGVYPSKDLHSNRDYMKFWFGCQDRSDAKPVDHSSKVVLNYTVMKEELRKQEEALKLFRNVEELASQDFPDGVVNVGKTKDVFM